MERQEYRSLREAETRKVYFAVLFHGPPTDILEGLLEYMRFSQQNLEEVGFEPGEAVRTGADSVFESVGDYLRDCDNTWTIDKVQSIDNLLRQMYEIDPREYPDSHEDPIIASFYTTLESHLNRSVPDDRFDAFGGYDR